MIGKGRVYLLGDSITQGLGSKKINFENDLSLLLGDGWEVVNLAYTGTTIEYALKLLREEMIKPLDSGPMVCVVVYGNVDAQIRPNSNGKIYPHLPVRYKGGGMLMPRPFYSHSPWKRIGQHLDNAVRLALSNLIKAVDGKEQWVHLDDFSNQYNELVNKLIDLGARVVCCSCIYIDECLFPETPYQYKLYSKEILKICKKYNLKYIDLFSIFKEIIKNKGWDSVYNKDHFHPNGEGYQVMANCISSAILGRG